ncbi:MAG TPA: hypothetical protein VH916_01585, partial [Dehalococcoidia bacterium]
MAEEWRIAVGRLRRHGVPLLVVRFNGLLDGELVLATSEPSTTLAPQVAEYLRFGEPPGRGRRIVPSDSGSLIASTLRLRSLSIPTLTA